MIQIMSIVAVLSIAQLAWAVERTTDGSGQVLLYPFVTTQNGWDTYANVAMTPLGGGMLKVRVLDGGDGGVVNSFNVYAKSGENWRAAFSERTDGQSIMRIAEGFCVVSDEGLAGGEGTDFPIATKVGMLEIYRIGARLSLSGLSCDDIASRWEAGGAWDQDPRQDIVMLDYQARVSGHFDVIDVSRGLSAEHVAIGLIDFVSSVPHTSPGSSSPSLEDADPVAVLSDGTEVIPDSGEGIDAVALLLSTKSGFMTNDVVTAPDIGASSDWIVSFPLRGYKTYGSYQLDFDGELKTCNENERIDSGETPTIEKLLDDPWASWGGGFSNTGLSGDIDPTPIVNYTPILCNTVNVLTFGDAAPIFLSPDSELQSFVGVLGNTLVLAGDSSTVRYTFTDGVSSSPGDNNGRPVVAFRATTFVNGTLNGGNILANYMILKPHQIQ